MSGLFGRIRNALLGDAASSGERHVLRGFQVLVENNRQDIDTSAVLQRLDDALGLIEAWQPWRLRHMRRDVSYFWIVRYPCRGAYFPGTRAIMTELTFLARRDITAAPVASSILPEGMHARISAMLGGVPSLDSAHEERVCRRAELAFGQALPVGLGAPVIERAMASLMLDEEGVAPTIDWTEARRRQDEADGRI